MPQKDRDPERLQRAVDFIIDKCKPEETHETVVKRLKAEAGIELSQSYVGNIRVQIRSGERKHSPTPRATMNPPKPAAPTAARTSEAPPADLTGNGGTVIPKPVVPTLTVATILNDLRATKEFAEKVGGYDKLIELATALKSL